MGRSHNLGGWEALRKTGRTHVREHVWFFNIQKAQGEEFSYLTF